jgi:hypothetical protein
LNGVEHLVPPLEAYLLAGREHELWNEGP